MGNSEVDRDVVVGDAGAMIANGKQGQDSNMLEETLGNMAVQSARRYPEIGSPSSAGEIPSISGCGGHGKLLTQDTIMFTVPEIAPETAETLASKQPSREFAPKLLNDSTELLQLEYE